MFETYTEYKQMAFYMLSNSSFTLYITIQKQNKSYFN